MNDKGNWNNLFSYLAYFWAMKKSLGSGVCLTGKLLQEKRTRLLSSCFGSPRFFASDPRLAVWVYSHGKHVVPALPGLKCSERQPVNRVSAMPPKGAICLIPGDSEARALESRRRRWKQLRKF